MSHHLTVQTLLRTTLVILATLAVGPLSMRAWDAARDLQTASRIVDVANASTDAFEVLAAVRSDRVSVPRAWDDPAPIAPALTTYLKGIQDPEMRAFRSLAARLEGIDFDDRDRLVPALRQALDRMTALQSEFWAGVAKPAADRRRALGDEYLRDGLALQTTLEDVATRLFAAIRRQDAFVDKMMTIKQLAWLARDNVGNASVIISRGLVAGSVPVGTYREYDADFGGSLAVWHGLETIAHGQDTPPALAREIAHVNQVLFSDEYTRARETMMTTLTSGRKSDKTANEWAMYAVPTAGFAAWRGQGGADGGGGPRAGHAGGGDRVLDRGYGRAAAGRRVCDRGGDRGRTPRGGAAACPARRHQPARGGHADRSRSFPGAEG